MPLTPIKNSADRIKDKLTILTAELIVVDCKLVTDKTNNILTFIAVMFNILFCHTSVNVFE